MAEQNETQTRSDTPTPNGGVYSIAYWKDKDGKPTTQAQYVTGEIVEFDADDKAIFRTYFTNGKEKAIEPVVEVDPVDEWIAAKEAEIAARKSSLES